MYIGDYLGRREIYSPDKLAIVDYSKNPEWRLTYRQWNARVNRLANWLRDVAGVNKGDRVAILARDGIEHLDCFYACAKLGAIHTALNWRLHWRENLGLIEQTQPKVLIYSDDFKAAVAEIENASRNTQYAIRHYLHIEGDGIAGSLHFETTLQASPAVPVTCESLEAEDIACLLFTGGTTGLPKGAMISHRMICWNVLNTVIHDLHHDDIYLNVYPLFHAGGLFAYLSSQVVFGNTTILVRQFDPALVLDLIEREQVTVFAGVPTMYQMMLQAPNYKTANLSSLRFCTCGGAPLPVPVIQQYIKDKGIRFKQGFGMTEFGPGLFALAPEDAERKAGSIGRPNFFVDVRVVDENNQPLGPNQVGELVLKGPSRCSGYWNNPEATRAMLDDEGWFHTGDMVRYDEEWYFYVVDRKKDMFISGGENVYPVEIESVLYKHPAVHMCAVIGVPDEKWGEVGKACVVLKPGMTATEEELIAFMQQHLARYKVPKSVVFLDSLPMSGMGKILKRELRQRFS
ncbi:MAG: long-chain fatty acid--CoA ligase [Anaerolineae bacterium]|nr:long-chain fatty acid--CoA ligase [Anaerolineae bacterium]